DFWTQSSSSSAFPAKKWRNDSVQKFPRHFFQRGNPKRMLVQARNLREFFSTRLKKIFTSAHIDFLNRLKAIRHKRRTNHQKFFYAALRKFRHLKIRVRLQPRVFAKPRLK